MKIIRQFNTSEQIRITLLNGLELCSKKEKAQALRLSFSLRWSQAELNCRHMDFQSIALPTELQDQWLRGKDLNQRPPGYGPDELPGCSTSR